MQAVCQLIDDALDGKIHYNAYSVKAQELGVSAIALDALRGVHTCYTNDGKTFDHPLKEIYEIAPTFNKDRVVAALAQFDAEQISARQFYKALADAGVAYARCTYHAQRAVYLGLNTDVYIEQW